MASTRKKAAKAPASAGRVDAIALLKADHQMVRSWFDEFETARNSSKKQQLASSICAALKVHCEIEEEIFYPAYLEATKNEDMHHEAVIEHDGAKKLIAEIESSGPEDEYFDAKVNVLGEMIRHHVKEEEKPDGMFAQARKSKMDLYALGEQLQARKSELEEGAGMPAMRRKPMARPDMNLRT
ncbi:MAG TPA: hemerythrin domain-containing protein [Steroidobacteraceae bacterium]|nr:hemerythrin domain-containing protein [Steroidobacteraceae bacterium]